jgi:acyl-coenzyme A synthetase/AMP-(fatty) acid ligase
MDVNWYENLKISLDDSCKPEKSELDDILMVVFSSGTTGKPKGTYLLDI